MTDEPDNVILLDLRRIDGKVDRLAEDSHDVKVRLTGSRRDWWVSNVVSIGSRAGSIRWGLVSISSISRIEALRITR